jgi:hypothetical protein
MDEIELQHIRIPDTTAFDNNEAVHIFSEKEVVHIIEHGLTLVDQNHWVDGSLVMMLFQLTLHIKTYKYKAKKKEHALLLSSDIKMLREPPRLNNQ